MKIHLLPFSRRALVAAAVLLNPALIRAATFNASTPAQLIGAITSANNETAYPGADTIVLAPGTYSFGTPVIWDFGPNALPVITSNITIEGHGATLTSTQAVRLRFFYVAGNGVGGLPTGRLTLRDLTLHGGKQKGGDSRGGGGAGMGGAIFNHGNLALERVTLSGNSVQGGMAGFHWGIISALGGGGMGEDGQSDRGGGFGGPFLGRGGSGGVSVAGPEATLYAGGGGGFLPEDDGHDGGNTATSGIGGGRSMLGGRGFVLYGRGTDALIGHTTEGGDGGGGAAMNQGTGGDFGMGGFAGGGGGVGGGGGYGGAGQRAHTPGGGGFGGGGGNGQGSHLMPYGPYGDGGFGGGAGACDFGFDNVQTRGGFAGGNGTYDWQGVESAGEGGGGGGMGGAIFNHLGHVAMVDCTVTGNIAAGGSPEILVGLVLGGGSGGSGFGAGVFNLNGVVSITRSTFTGNQVVPGSHGENPNYPESRGQPGEAHGAAIYNLAYGLTFTGGFSRAYVILTDSTLLNAGASDFANDKRDMTTWPNPGSGNTFNFANGVLFGRNVIGSAVARGGTDVPRAFEFQISRVDGGLPTQKKLTLVPYPPPGMSAAFFTKTRLSDSAWIPLTNTTTYGEGSGLAIIDNAATTATKSYRVEFTIPAAP